MSYETIFCFVYAAIAGIVGISFTISLNNKKKFDGAVSGQIIGYCYDPAELNQEDTGMGKMRSPYAGEENAYTTSSFPIFSYEVDGITYERASYVYISRGAIRRKQKKGVTVYYQTINPQQSTIFNGRGIRIARNILFIVAIALLCVGYYFR